MNLALMDTFIQNTIKHTRSTRFGGVGEFGGFFASVDLEHSDTPISMITSVDGVGTKLEFYKKLGCYYGVGVDLIAMVFNDIICRGWEIDDFGYFLFFVIDT